MNFQVDVWKLQNISLQIDEILVSFNCQVNHILKCAYGLEWSFTYCLIFKVLNIKIGLNIIWLVSCTHKVSKFGLQFNGRAHVFFMKL